MNGAIDDMTAFAVQALLSSDNGDRLGVVRTLATKWPNQPALAVVFALTSAASHIESQIDTASDRERRAFLGYRLAAVLAGDVHALRSMGNTDPKSHDLLHFWRRVDPYFLEL